MRIAKWGNSLAVRLPKELVDLLSLKAGDELTIVDASRERLAVAKDQRRKQALERLAAMRIKLPEDYKFDREEANERARQERRKGGARHCARASMETSSRRSL